MKCRVWSEECGACVECRVWWSLECCGVRSVECKVWSVKCKL